MVPANLRQYEAWRFSPVDLFHVNLLAQLEDLRRWQENYFFTLTVYLYSRTKIQFSWFIFCFLLFDIKCGLPALSDLEEIHGILEVLQLPVTFKL